MRRYSIRVITLLTALGIPALLHAQADRQAVLGTIDSFLNALKQKDTVAMAQHTDSLTRLTLLRPGPNGTRVVVLGASEFIRAVAAPSQPAFEEPIRNPVVQIDGDLATVWAEYQVISQGRVTHCGYDAFHLARLDGRWKILNVSDTYRQSGCGEPWATAKHH